ncbi:hypothetical protein FIU91_15005 [Roseivivax sp. THAF30]|nr:hypothetical protein FIU91_15005 [Roseivivax sp. THAF30]
MRPMTHLPLQQSPEFHNAARALGWPVMRRVLGAREVNLIGRTTPFGRVTLLSRADPPLPEELRTIGGLILVNAETGPCHPGLMALRAPRQHALVELGPKGAMRAGLRQKWRNRLSAAERSRLSTTHGALPPNPDHWLLKAEAAQARRLRYAGWPPALSSAWAKVNRGEARLFEAQLGGRPIAGLVLLRHGPSATYQMSVTTPEGQRMNAMTLLLWRAMCWASKVGCHDLDLGHIDPANAGLTRFKIGTGARIRTLGPTLLWHRSLSALPLGRSHDTRGQAASPHV